MRSAARIVESRWATMIVVRPTLSRSSASWTSRSDSLSSELVASSSSRIGGSLRIARAIATRWRWPPERRIPRSPTMVSYPSEQRRDERMGVGVAGGGLDLVLGRVEAAVPDVVADRAAEERRFLGHEADPLAQARRRDAPDVLTIDGDAARRHIPQPWDQADERRLARSGRPDEGEALPCPDVEVDGAQDRLARLVGEGHPAERDAARRSGRSRRHRARRPRSGGCR